MFSRNRLLYVLLTVTILSVNLYFLVQFRSTFNEDSRVTAEAINEKIIIGQFTKMLNRSRVIDLFASSSSPSSSSSSSLTSSQTSTATTKTTTTAETGRTDSVQSDWDTAVDLVTTTTSSSSSSVEQSLTYQPNYHSTLMTIDEARGNSSLNTFHLFKFIINPEFKICGRKQNDASTPTLIAFVPISVSNFRGRLAIRHTWSNYNLFNGLRVVFLTGLSQSEKVNKNLKIENDIYGDIVQADFQDTYRNLTIKTMMGLKWVSTYCNNTKFVLKVDDDVVVNTHFLLKRLRSLSNKKKWENAFFCNVLNRQPVNRNHSSKYYMSRFDYRNQLYPTYCRGTAYLFTADLPAKLYALSFYTRHFVFEDVYVGMLANQLKSKYYDYTKYYYIDKKRAHKFAVENLPRSIDSYLFIYIKEFSQFNPVWDALYNSFIAFIFKFYFF